MAQVSLSETCRSLGGKRITRLAIPEADQALGYHGRDTTVRRLLWPLAPQQSSAVEKSTCPTILGSPWQARVDSRYAATSAPWHPHVAASIRSAGSLTRGMGLVCHKPDPASCWQPWIMVRLIVDHRGRMIWCVTSGLRYMIHCGWFMLSLYWLASSALAQMRCTHCAKCAGTTPFV